MDFEKMCNTDNQGFYTLLFPNKHALQMDEIKEYFSQFEGFIDVRAAGTEKGHRFPRFKTSEGAKRAFEALAGGHPTISLIPYVNNRKNSNNQKNRSNKENFGNNNNNRSDSKKDSDCQSIWDFDKPQILKEDACKQEDSPKPLNDSTRKNEGSSISMRLMKYRRDPELASEKTESSEINLAHDENIQCMKSSAVSDNDAVVKNNIDVDLADENNITNEVNGVNEFTTAVNGFNEVTTAVNGFSENTAASKVNEFSEDSSRYSENIGTNDDEIPGLVVRAGEVIVGNIHPSFGPAYILHLFDKYEPLAISTIQNIKNHRFRYCHVYFKTSADATEVENQFDWHELMGRKLLVLQPKTLVKLI